MKQTKLMLTELKRKSSNSKTELSGACRKKE